MSSHLLLPPHLCLALFSCIIHRSSAAWWGGNHHFKSLVWIQATSELYPLLNPISIVWCGGWGTSQKISGSSCLQGLQSKYCLHLKAFESFMGHSQSWWKSMQVCSTLAAMPADTRQRIRAVCVWISWLSAMQRIGLSSFADCLRPHECLLIFKHATLNLRQRCWEEHWCFILEYRSSKSNVHLTNLILKSLRKALKTKAQIPEWVESPWFLAVKASYQNYSQRQYRLCILPHLNALGGVLNFTCAACWCNSPDMSVCTIMK